MEMKPVGLCVQQKQSIAFGNSKAIQTGSREVFEFLSKDFTKDFSKTYKNSFLKKYNIQFQEQASNNDMLGVVVNGFQKKILDVLSYAYAKLPDSKLATKILHAKNRYSANLYKQSANEMVEIKTLKDLRRSFPV